MAIDPSISLGVRPPQIAPLDLPDPFQQAGKVMTLQNLMQQRQLGQMQLQEHSLQLQQAQQAAKERADLADYLQSLKNPTPQPAPAAGGAPGSPAPANSPVTPPAPTIDYNYLIRNFPIHAPGIIKAAHEGAMASLDEQTKQLEIAQKQNARRAQLAGSIADEGTKTAAIATALQEGLITPQQRDALAALPFDSPAFKQFQTQGLQADQQLSQAIAAKKEERDAQTFKHDQAMYPSQEAKAKSDAAESALKTAQAQRAQDAQTLAGAIGRGPDAYAAALAALPEDRRAPFASAKNITDIMRVPLTPEQFITTSEAQRHNLSSESTAKLTASIAAGRLAEKRKVNNLKYGPGTAEYWVQQLHENPDSVKEMPPELRSTVGQAFKKAYDLPLPTPLGDTAKATETAARTALDGIDFIRNAVKDPEIQNRLGPILGRLGDKEQDIGATIGLSPAAAEKAQQLRTRLRYFVFSEGKAVLGGRLPQNLMAELEKSSGNVHMDAPTLEGALKGAEGAAQTTISNLDRQRFGGKSRGGSTPAGGTVRMKAPDGTIADVPADQVAHYKSLGAEEVK